ncbi:MAG: LysE family translocator [Pseudonocardiaceae bacterium]
MTVDRWLAFVAVLTVALALPGPDFAVVLRHGLRSTRAGAAAAAGVLTGLLTHGCLAAAGLSAVVAAHPGLLTALRLVGTAYLAGLGMAALLAWRRTRRHPAGRDRPAMPAAGGGERAYRDGALTNLLNPKALLFFLGVVPHFLTWDSGVSATTLLLGGTTIVVAAFWYGLLLAILAQVHRLLARPRMRSGVDAVTGVALLTVAGSLALS